MKIPKICFNAFSLNQNYSLLSSELQNLQNQNLQTFSNVSIF